MSPIALHPNPDLRDDLDSPADASHPPAGVVAMQDRFSLVRGIPWILLLVTIGIGLLDRGFTQRWDTFPFLVSFLFFGMPHGAMDWVVDGRLRTGHGARRALPRFTWYLAWMGVSMALLLVAPVLAVGAFFVLTVIHWGLGDLIATAPDATARRTRFAAITGRGLLVLGVAFAVAPAAAWAPFALLTETGPISPEMLADLRLLGLLASTAGGLATLLWIADRWRRDQRRQAVHDAAETLLVVAAIGLTDPLFGIGVYFLSTHSFRHSIRLASTREVLPNGVADGTLTRRLLWVHLLSLPLLVPTLALILGWCWLQFGRFGPEDLTATMLGFFLVTTLPHHLLGRRLPATRRR